MTENATYACILRSLKNSSLLRRLHAHLARHGRHRTPYVANLLVHGYAVQGLLGKARAVFDNLLACGCRRDRCSWNVIISAYARLGQGQEALRLFRQMGQEGVRYSRVTLVSALHACATSKDLRSGEQIHRLLLLGSGYGYKADVTLSTALVTMYGKCGHVREAREIFDETLSRNIISWTAMITSYAQNGYGREALALFHQMDSEGIAPDRVTFLSALDACTGPENLTDGREIHKSISSCSDYSSDITLYTALLSMYARCNSLNEARIVFDSMKRPDLTSWNAMLAAYSQTGNGDAAVKLFQQMLNTGLKPDKVTLLCILNACTSLASVECARVALDHISACGLETDVALQNALICLLGRCGDLEQAQSVFDGMPDRDVISWNSMLAAYAQNGRIKEALEVFRLANSEKEGSLQPSKVTFIGLLNMCSHGGLHNEGWLYLVSMSNSYGMTPSQEHFISVIDLLGRTGYLDEAEDLVENMPVPTDVVVWRILLSACRTHGDIQRAMRAAVHIVSLSKSKVAGSG